MRRWWLEITLKSDMCAATGDSEKGLTDTKTALEYGIPLIHGKRIKGCLLNEGKEMSSNGFISKEVLERLFGTPGSASSGNLHISDAHIYRVPGSIFHIPDVPDDVVIEDYDAVLEELRGDSELNDKVAEEVLTRMRTRTAINRETGIAQNKTLRSMQVVPRGVMFRSCLEFSGTETMEEVEALQCCVKALRHIGLGITRGFGEVHCTLKEDTRPIPEAGATKTSISSSKINGELLYEIELKAPVIFAGDTGLYEDCSDQIPGAALMGAFADMFVKDRKLGAMAHEDETFSRIFLRDGVQFGYGFLKSEGKVFYPCPAHLAKKKDLKTDEPLQIINRLSGENEQVRRKEITDQVALDPDHHMIYLADVEKEIRMHHERPVDRGIGHALNDRFEAGAVDMGQLFQYNCLTKGQHFSGCIRGKSEDLALLLECLERRHGRLLLGRSRTAEYGEAAMQCAVNTVQGQDKPAKHWLLWLLTPLAAMDLNQGDIRPEELYLEQQMKYVLGCGVKIKGKLLKYTKTGGYNSRWRLPMPQYGAFSPGSVLVIETDRDVYADELEGVRWGAMTGRGYGQIKALREEVTGDSMDVYTIKEIKNTKLNRKKKDPFVEILLQCQKEQMRVVRETSQALASNSLLPNMVTISRLIQLIEDGKAGSYEEIMKYVDRIQSDSKREAARAFMKPCKNRSMDFIKMYLDHGKWRARKEAGYGEKGK